MMAYGAESPLDFMAGNIRRIKPAQLEETVLVLPLDYVEKLMKIMLKLLESKVRPKLTLTLFLKENIFDSFW